MIRMVVADRNETMRLGVRTLFANQAGKFEVCEASNKAELLKKIEKDHYNLVMVDPILCDKTGEALLRQIRATSPKSHILVYTDLDELRFGIRALRCGAKGYVMKNRTAGELIEAASRVGTGKVHMSEALAEVIAMDMSGENDRYPHESLSERELLVFSMLVCGWSITRIAAALHLSVKTVSTHKARASVKLGCKSLSDLIQYALAHGLTEDCKARCMGR